MEAKYRLDIGKKEKRDSFVFDLSNLRGTELELSIEYIAYLLQDAIEDENFNYGYQLIEMAKRLRDYDNSFLFHIEANLRIEECLKKIHSRKTESLMEVYRIKNCCDETINFIKGNFDVEIRKEIIEKRNEIMELNEKIEIAASAYRVQESLNKDYLKIKELLILEEMLKNSNKYKVEKNKIESLLNIYIEKLNKEVLKLNREKIKISKIKNLFEDVREDEFLESKEFLNIFKEESAFHSYESLMKIEEKSYQLYKFNNNNDLKEEISILCKLDIEKFNSLPNVYKECAAIRLKKNYNKTLELKWLYKFMDEIILDILKNNSKKVVLIP